MGARAERVQSEMCKWIDLLEYETWLLKIQSDEASQKI
jgi:hypothetical protein